MNVIDCEQGSEAWHAARAGLATASRFADVLATIQKGEAASRRNYRAELVVQRLTGKVAESYQSAEMRLGTEREPMARDAYMVESGLFVEQIGFCRHDKLEAGASPDGLILSGGRGGLEIKCPGAANHAAYLELATEPSDYTAQIQGQMWIAELDWVDFVSFHPDYPPDLQLQIVRVERDEAYIARLAAAVEKFMEEVRAQELRLRNLRRK